MSAVAGERMDAFEKLYELYQPKLARFLDRMLRRPAAVEEVLDDTMLIVWRKAHTFNPAAKVSTWIFGIAYRQALAALRASEGEVEFRGDRIDVEDEQSDPIEATQRSQRRFRIEVALRSLSPEHRAVIELTYFFGHSCRDIADIQGCPVNTVKTRMFYARRHLRSLLADSGEEEAL